MAERSHSSGNCRIRNAVYIIPSAGGPERKLAICGEGVSWSPDGKWLALANLPAPQGSGGLFLLSLSTGERRELSVPQNATDSLPVYSPDGHWIAFMRLRSERDVFILPASGGPTKQLTFDAKPKRGLTWSGDSREIVYSMLRESGGAGLWRVSISGGEPRRFASTLDFAGNPNISRKGESLVYTESWIDSNIYRSDGFGFAGSDFPGEFGDPHKVIASSREDHSPSFSPDGKRIAFVSNRTGHSEIWTARHDGSHEVQLTHFETFTGTPRWSPDGGWIAFDCIRDGNKDIWVIGADGGAARRLTKNNAPDTKPSWSPDGAWIYFNSDRSGAPQVWKMKPDGTAATQLTWHGGGEPLPSVDGRTIYYTKHAGPASIWQVPAEGGPEQPLAGMEQFNKIARAWGVLKQGIYFVSAERGARAEMIGFFSFGTGRVTPLRRREERAMWTVPSLSISPDGRYLLTVKTDQQVNDLMMIENFR